MKKKVIILIAGAILLAGSFFYLHFSKSRNFEPQIKAKLSALVTTASDGYYKLDMDHIDIDIIGGSITAKHIYLLPDSARLCPAGNCSWKENTVTVYIKQISLSGISPLDLLDKKHLDLDELIIDSPEIKLVHRKTVTGKNDASGVYDKIPLADQSYSLKKLSLNHARLTISDGDKNRQVSSFDNLSAYFSDILIDSVTKKDASRFLFAKQALIAVKGYHSETSSKMYRFSIDSIAMKPLEKIVTLSLIKLKPVGSRDEFSSKLRFMDDRFDIDVKQAVFKNINWYSLLAGEGFYADDISLSGGNVNVYDDRRLPLAKTKVGKFPHQLLMRAGMPVSVQQARVEEFNIVYEEFNPKANKTGHVEFSHVKGLLSNVTNIPADIQQNPVAAVTASAKLMNAGELKANFRFYLNKAHTGDFELDVLLGKMNGVALNETANSLALMNVKELSITQLQGHITGANYAARGKVKFEYTDLSVDLLKAADDGTIKKKTIISFLADKFVLKKSNQPADEYFVTYERNTQKSFFNLVWKTILEGIKKSVKK